MLEILQQHNKIKTTKNCKLELGDYIKTFFDFLHLYSFFGIISTQTIFIAEKH